MAARKPYALSRGHPAAPYIYPFCYSPAHPRHNTDYILPLPFNVMEKWNVEIRIPWSLQGEVGKLCATVLPPHLLMWPPRKGGGFAWFELSQLAPKTKTIVNVVVRLLSNAANVWPFPAQIFGEYMRISNAMNFYPLLLRPKSMYNHLQMAIALLYAAISQILLQKNEKKSNATFTVNPWSLRQKRQ